ncbi:MAG: hypothetical protein AAFQ19_05905 [Pseudomonadota bacterium]
MMRRTLFHPIFVLLAAALALAGCDDYADYSLAAYTNATEMKAKSLALLAKSGAPYAVHGAEAEAVLLQIDVAYEFAAGFEANQEAADMWALIRDPEEGSVGGFVALWRRDFPQGLSPGFRTEFERATRFAFDRLICLEANKREPASCAPLP